MTREEWKAMGLLTQDDNSMALAYFERGWFVSFGIDKSWIYGKTNLELIWMGYASTPELAQATVLTLTMLNPR